MTNNVTQISDYQTEDTPTSNIFQTIEKTKADLEGETAEVIPFEKPEDDELSDDDIEFLWDEAVNQSFEIIDKSERPVEVLLLIANLVDDLIIRDVRISSILSAVKHGLELDEDRVAEMEAEAE
ncbi:uncharacterized protein METZ01_LOCUS499943 [marine metagenome]|uniref:Uncharacterized protein n=1 Tax=marine metagenome TaxID=408172 RepID=A0A383DS02_9ZZZZ